jgi:hypothetical protein
VPLGCTLLPRKLRMRPAFCYVSLSAVLQICCMRLAFACTCPVGAVSFCTAGAVGAFHHLVRAGCVTCVLCACVAPFTTWCSDQGARSSSCLKYCVQALLGSTVAGWCVRPCCFADGWLTADRLPGHLSTCLLWCHRTSAHCRRVCAVV